MLEQVMESICNTDGVVGLQRTDTTGFVEMEVNFLPTILSEHADSFELGTEDFSIFLPKKIKGLNFLDINEVEVEYEHCNYWLIF